MQTVSIKWYNSGGHTIPYNSVQLRTTPAAIQLRTTPYNSVQLRTTPYNSIQLRTTPYNSGGLHTLTFDTISKSDYKNEEENYKYRSKTVTTKRGYSGRLHCLTICLIRRFKLRNLIAIFVYIVLIGEI